MKRLMLLLLSCISINAIFAQKGHNSISLNAEAAIPVYQKDRGFGFFLKGAYGVGKAAQLTLSAGVSKFTEKNPLQAEKVTTRLVPVLFGYKQYFRRVYLEPKAGIGELGGKIFTDGYYARPSVAAVFGGLAAGYSVKRINVGVQFLTARGFENMEAGTWHNKAFHYTSIQLGYNLFSRSRQ